MKAEDMRYTIEQKANERANEIIAEHRIKLQFMVAMAIITASLIGFIAGIWHAL